MQEIKMRELSPEKDTEIHSFGLLDVDVWTLRRFQKNQVEKNTYI